MNKIQIIRKILTKYPYANISNVSNFKPGMSIDQFVKDQVDIDELVLKLKNEKLYNKSLLFTKYSDKHMKFLKESNPLSAFNLSYLTIILMFVLTPFILCGKIIRDVIRIFKR